MAVRKSKSEAKDVETPDLVPYEPGGNRATPLVVIAPVEVEQLSQMGSTFADRAKARMATEKRIASGENK